MLPTSHQFPQSLESVDRAHVVGHPHGDDPLASDVVGTTPAYGLATVTAMTLIIFLVEDSETIRDNLIPTIEELVGASVVKFVEGEGEARAWLRTNDNWHLAVVDLFLTEGSGLGVLRSLQTRAERQRVVVLSNYATAEMKAQCTFLGADRVFDKSTELEAFLSYCAERASTVA